nr:MAG TPA: hypothetical protein [Caudoviricetes sp.]
MSSLKDKETRELIAEWVTLDKQRKANAKQANQIKAELQARGLAYIDDHNERYVKFYGDTGSCSVTDAMSLEVLNVDKLKALLTPGFFDSKVTVTVKPSYDYDKKLEQALKAIFTGDYSFENLEDFLDGLSPAPDAKQKKLLLKKLKGDYEKDLETLEAVFGKSPDGDYDVELFYIHRIKNGELIKAFLPDEGLDYMLQEIRKVIIVETKTAIKLDYEED